MILYAFTLFVSAFLLFLVQPIVGKMILPTLGGTPVAWNTCMVFFQMLLLGGYLYAHVATKRFGVILQSRWHLVLLGAALVVLAVLAAVYGQPVAIEKDLTPQGSDVPVFGILLVLFLAVGVPFFTVATTAPLLQRWFSKSGHPGAKDPYFLYAASNVGSVLALVVYPAAVEPNLPLKWQSWLWAGGFAILAVLIGLCAFALPKSESREAHSSAEIMDEPVTWLRRVRWLALAAVPSSLMLGVTTYLVTDIASMPLFWIIPLGIYLMSFIIAFMRLPKYANWVFGLVMPVAVLVLIFVRQTHMLGSTTSLFALHLSTFAAVALGCHSELASNRPTTSRLTEFYLIMSLGGVLGGLFNTLIAPLVFNDVHEYNIALAGACFLIPMFVKPATRTLSLIFDALFPIAIFSLALFLTYQKRDTDVDAWQQYLMKALTRGDRWADQISPRVAGFLDLRALHTFTVLTAALPIVFSFLGVHRPWRFGLAVAAILLAFHLEKARSERNPDSREQLVLRARSPFGVLKVSRDGDDDAYFHTLTHGNITHGQQIMHPEELTPITYYHTDGPIGDIFLREFKDERIRRKMAFVGLGTGSLATYCGPGQSLTYFEIDPLVRRIATDPKLFTYYTRCQAQKEIVLGDARIQLERRKDDKYDLIIVDAFSSDAIPVHLLTREAMELYLDRLAAGGALLLHISNRYLDLAPVVARHVQDMRLQAWHIEDTADDSDPNHWISEWVLVALPTTPFRFVPTEQSNWIELKHNSSDPLWTDDFSSVLSVLMDLNDYPRLKRWIRGE